MPKSKNPNFAFLPNLGFCSVHCSLIFLPNSSSLCDFVVRFCCFLMEAESVCSDVVVLGGLLSSAVEAIVVVKAVAAVAKSLSLLQYLIGTLLSGVVLPTGCGAECIPFPELQEVKQPDTENKDADEDDDDGDEDDEDEEPGDEEDDGDAAGNDEEGDLEDEPEANGEGEAAGDEEDDGDDDEEQDDDDDDEEEDNDNDDGNDGGEEEENEEEDEEDEDEDEDDEEQPPAKKRKGQ